MTSTIAFTGHMVDRPGRSTPRFPTSLAPQIAKRIAAELEAARATDGFASGACGGDILFLEAMLARGGRAHVALPCAVESFRRDCVDIIPGFDWGSRFDRILEQASTLEILGEQYASDNAMASECCSRVLIGMAARCAMAQRGGTRGARVVGRAAGRCGRRDLFLRTILHRSWLQNSLDVRPVSGLCGGNPRNCVRRRRHVLGSQPYPADERARQQICAVVFADAVGFSKLREREVPAFSRHYLACAMAALQSHEVVPLVKNTWGDGLYLVFESVRDAGLFAVDFRDRILATPWRQLGFTSSLSVRIAVHAGPLYRIYDPLIGQWSYTGAQVTRTARLEPSTDAGKVFASLAFVALAAAERVKEFA